MARKMEGYWTSANASLSNYSLPLRRATRLFGKIRRLEVLHENQNGRTDSEKGACHDVKHLAHSCVHLPYGNGRCVFGKRLTDVSHPGHDSSSQ